MRNEERTQRGKFIGEQLDALVDSLPQLVATTEPDGKLLTLNRVGRCILGIHAEDDLTGSSLAHFIPPQYRGEFWQKATDTAMEKGTWRGEMPLLHRQGQEIPAAIILLAHCTPAGELSMLSFIANDLRKQNMLEEALRQSQKIAMVGQLADGLAHDFNNLLLPITGYIDLLLDKLPPEDSLRRYAEQVASITEHAAALPRQLLAFSRSKPSQPQLVDLNKTIADLAKILTRLIGESIILESNLAAEPVMLKIDPGQLEQVLLNLAVNARDAMPRGGHLFLETALIRLTTADIQPGETIPPGAYAQLSVSDTGSGMDPETRAHIFEPFFTTKEEGKGTGLGLTTAHSIISQNSGTIRVSSIQGEGTTFQIYLPQADAAIPKTRTAATPPMFSNGEETLLIAEDDQAVRESLSEGLRLLGYTVHSARDSEEAMRLAKAHQAPIHLLMTDIVMPGQSGNQLAEDLAELHPEIKTLFISGYAEDVILRYGEIPPQSHFLQKPFTMKVLAAKVRAILDVPLSPSRE